jgi:hypothetical protein
MARGAAAGPAGAGACGVSSDMAFWNGFCADYFLIAGFVFSCLGFLFFLSFFCELLPLPMAIVPFRSVCLGN